MDSSSKHPHIRRISLEIIEHYVKILPNFDFLRETHQLGQRPITLEKETT